MPKSVSVRKLKVTLMLKVSHYGSGYYMRIPTDIAESLMLRPGDRVQLQIQKVIPKEVKTLAGLDP